MDPISDRSRPWAHRFGPFEVDWRTGELRRDGLRVRLAGRPFDLLAILLERPGEIVSREELRSRLWTQDTFVDFDHGLNVSVNRLREALGDSADSPRYVETVPRRGYRFVAPVSASPEPQAAGSDPDRPPAAPARPPSGRSRRVALAVVAFVAGVAGVWWWSTSVRPPPTPEAPRSVRLAVLPFRALGDDQSYFSEGVTDALIAELAQLQALRVISRASATAAATGDRPLSEIARDLGVGAVVEGSVLRSGNRVRITAQLVDVPMDRTVWARNYDCDLDDVLDVQLRVVREITEGIRVAVTPSEGARLQRSSRVVPEAYEAYLRGRQLRERFDPGSLDAALELFVSAVERDPDYAAAHAALADTYWILGTAGFESRPQVELAPRARAAAERALALDPGLPEAEAALAMVEAFYDWDFDTAGARLARVVARSPSYARAHVRYGVFLVAVGRFDQAIEEARRGLELDPLSVTAQQTLAWRYLYAGRHDQARTEFARALARDPGAWVARLGLGLVGTLDGDPGAIPEMEHARRDAGGSLWALSALGHAYAASGRRDEAMAVLSELEAAGRDGRYLPAYYAAPVLVALGERDAALAALERAVEERSGWAPFVAVEPELAPLHGEPRFEALVARVGNAGALRSRN